MSTEPAGALNGEGAWCGTAAVLTIDTEGLGPGGRRGGGGGGRAIVGTKPQTKGCGGPS